MKYFTKYLTSAPVMATVALVFLSVVMIELNHVFPGLQYGTYTAFRDFSQNCLTSYQRL